MNTTDATGVVIVNYNAGNWLPRCVEAVAESAGPVEIIVVDNASTDDSVERLCAALPMAARVEVVRNTANTGYARACNQGAAQTEAFTLVFLNPDCIVESDTLAILRRALDEDSRAGLAGALILDPGGSEQRAVRRRLPTPGRALSTLSGLERLGVGGINAASDPLPAHPVEVEAVSGALLCLRRQAFDAVGGFDEDYFLHCEDLDLFVRLRAGGWKLLLVPAARAMHGLGVSSASAPLRAWWYKHLGMHRFYRRHLATQQSWPVPWLVLAGIWLRWALLMPWVAVRSLGAHQPADPD